MAFHLPQLQHWLSLGSLYAAVAFALALAISIFSIKEMAKKPWMAVLWVSLIVLTLLGLYNSAIQEEHQDQFESKISEALKLPPGTSAEALAEAITRKTSRARLQFSSIAPAQYPGQPAQEFNITFKDAGTLAASRAVLRMNGLISDRVLSADEQKQQMGEVQAAIRALDISKLNSAEIQPNDSALITLSDANGRPVFATPSDLSDIENAKKFVNVFAVANFEDEEVAGRGYWVMEFCGYFTVRWDYWHNCAVPNQVYFVDHAR